jgi:hypothetical protein
MRAPRKRQIVWEWNWPRFWGWKYNLTVFSANFTCRTTGDHAPEMHVELVILNLCLLDFGFYNFYHVDD